jgi:hypothetical protein
LGITVLRALGIRTPNGSRPSTNEVLARTTKAISIARNKGFKGVLLVLDELGKNLEFAVQNREADDIFLLQRLAEEAAHSGAELLQFLSEQCDRIYNKAPRVLNELINRRYPSSAAVGARTKLVEAMATAHAAYP